MAFVPLLESARRAHEDYENLLHLGADALSLSRGEEADRIPQEHSARSSTREAEHLAAGLVRSAVSRAETLGKLYSDPTNKPAAPTQDLSAALSLFYEHLREVKAVHSGEVVSPETLSSGAALLAEVAPPEEFSGEECGGKYLDFQPHHAAYVNLFVRKSKKRKRTAEKEPDQPATDGAVRNGGGKPLTAKQGPAPSKTSTNPEVIDFVLYVKKRILAHDSVPPDVRRSPPYLAYLRGLLEYLVVVCERLHPLINVRALMSLEEDRMRERFSEGLQVTRGKSDSAEALLSAHGADGVRDELFKLGLKGGGRPMDRAVRLWAVLSAPPLPTKEMLRQPGESAGLQPKSEQALDQGSSKISTAKEANAVQTISPRVFLEGLLSLVLEEMLPDEYRATVLNVEKKQSLSWAELEAERVAEESMAEQVGNKNVEDEDPEDEKPLYNPKDVPLGWDGKPIPFWLYKLHGLNHEYRCEICGGATYRGPRAFERHFTDAQHVHGLRCLGITYSKEFYMVVKIADAVKLRDKLRNDSKRTVFNAEMEVEYEDKEGNVLNRKTYRDLERQGLLS